MWFIRKEQDHKDKCPVNNVVFTVHVVDFLLVFCLDTRQLESHLDSIQQKHIESRDPVVAEMRRLTDTFMTSAEQMKSHVLAAIQSQLSNEVQKSMSG